MTNPISSLRGHEIYYSGGRWLYADTRTPTVGNPRVCGSCKRERTPDDHDGCLGSLPGVLNACCGHGQKGLAYVQFEGGAHIQGEEAVKAIVKLKGGVGG